MMTRTIRFHLDEHVSPAIADGLRRRGIDVTTTVEVGLVSASDEEQLAYGWDQRRIVVTYDDDFLRLANRRLKHAGIVHCIQGNRSVD